MQSPDTVIIGGGVVGASVAFHLTERGCRDVLILEREAQPGLGSTGRATGGIRAQFETEINIRLSLYSLDLLRDGQHDCGYDPRGYLFVATDDSQLAFLQRSVERQRSLGYVECSLVDPQAVAELAPGLNCDDIVGGSFGPRDGFLDPVELMNGFISRARANGARLETVKEVRSIATAGGRVTGVRTAAGTISCETVVLCAGAWSSVLAGTAGIDLPVEPLRRQIVWARSSQPLPPQLPMVVDLSNGFHFRPARDSTDEVLLAFPDPHETPSFSTDFHPTFADTVYQKVRHRVPFLADSAVIREKCRAGLYENTPDHHAILGHCDVEGLYLATGFSGHGVMHSPATGRALSEIILDGQASFMDVSSLNVRRFKTGDLLHETAFI